MNLLEDRERGIGRIDEIRLLRAKSNELWSTLSVLALGLDGVHERFVRDQINVGEMERQIGLYLEATGPRTHA